MFKFEIPVNSDIFIKNNISVDLGYYGIEKEYQAKTINIPFKKSKKSKLNPNPELSKEQKKVNKKLSSFWVLIENAISGVKRYSILTQRFRNKSLYLNDLVMLLGCGLWNYHLKFAKFIM